MEKTISIGVVGLGGRGMAMLNLILGMDDVEVTAVCDLHAGRLQAGTDRVKEMSGEAPTAVEDYRALLEMSRIDAIMIFTSWADHVHIAADAMNAGKYTAVEVGGAYSIHDCWKLVSTYEQTGSPCMLLENCCYGRDELMILNMVKIGVFGEIVHCQGGYRHDLRNEITYGKENYHYRLDNYLRRNCENYPTHELGPIAKILGINKGNRMLSLTSVASKSRGLHEYILKEQGADYYLANADFAQGDVVTTIIKCAGGETIVLTLDTTLPRPYSRGLHIQGTKGIYMEDNQSIFLDELHKELHFDWSGQWGNIEHFREQYEHQVWRDYRPDSNQEAGHGGMDYLVLREFFDSVKNKTIPPIDVYDMAAWMSVTALSEQSIAMGQTVFFPDFTNGRWIKG